MYIEVGPDIYRIDDRCISYLIKDENNAVIIDFGSGKVLDCLNELGINNISAVFITVPQRNHCQGLHLLPDGVPVYFPDGTRDLINSHRPKAGNPVINNLFPGVYELPWDVPEYNDMPVNYIFGKFKITPMQIGGFTELQTVYMLDFDNDRLCFCGDSIAAPGKIHAAYNFEHMHHTGTGQYRGVEALRRIRMERPDVLLPAHGKIIDKNIYDTLSQTIKALTELAEVYETNCPGVPASVRIPVQTGKFQRLSEHIFMRGNSYLVISETKEVLLVDFFAERKDQINEFLRDFNDIFPEHEITCILISHYHYDHWLGINELRDIFKIKTGCCEFMVDSLQNPPAYKRPFQNWPGIKIDMQLKDMQDFIWNEYEFTAYEFSGQTNFHSGYYSQIDGKKVFFTGDNFYPVQQWGGTGGLSSLNGGDLINGWPRSIKLMLKINPDWVLASHSQPFMFSIEDFKARLLWVDDAIETMKNISDEEYFQLCFNQQLFTTYPYSQLKKNKIKVTFTAVNPTDRTINIKVKPIIMSGIEVIEKESSLNIKAFTQKSQIFNFVCSLKHDETAMVAFDITRDSKYLGQIAECFFC